MRQGSAEARTCRPGLTRSWWSADVPHGMLAIPLALLAGQVCVMLGRCDPLNEPGQPGHDKRMHCELLNSVLDQKKGVSWSCWLSLPKRHL